MSLTIWKQNLMTTECCLAESAEVCVACILVLLHFADNSLIWSLPRFSQLGLFFSSLWSIMSSVVFRAIWWRWICLHSLYHEKWFFLLPLWYSSLGWRSRSFKDWSVLLQALLALQVFIEKQDDILMDFCIYVTCFFSWSCQYFFFILYI